MPIRPENKKRYPKKKEWEQIRARVLKRAGNCCEGSPAYPDCRAENHKPHPVTGAKVVLTIAHLDHIPEHCDERTNLRAWCQKCHNTYDAPRRALNRKVAKLEKENALLRRSKQYLMEELNRGGS